MMEPTLTMENHQVIPDFQDTATAFAHLSDAELRSTARLFNLMSKPWIVRLGSSLGLWCVKWNLPFVRWLVKKTIFRQFVGGQSLLDCMPTIEKLAKFNTLTILDYGVEGREKEEDFNATLRENLRAIEFAMSNPHVPVVSTKLSGLASNRLLEKVQRGDTLSAEEDEQWRSVVKRVEGICFLASQKGMSVFIDAEESWIQDPIDDLVMSMMRRFNKHRVVVYNTYQMYRSDRLKMIMQHAAAAEAEGWMLGAKIVRGAYMEKERERARQMGYPSPIQPDKRTTDEAYNKALRFLVENHRTIASCNATHNAESCRLMAQWIDEQKIERNHPHLNFSQLYGMSDNISFNLAAAGYNVAKYVPYGCVQEVIPYLIRRAEENSSITGEVSRELLLFQRELKRRAALKQ